MFLDEARMAARISHPHVVEVLDVVADEAGGGELFLVMPYVHGDSLAHLLVRARADGSLVPLDVAATIMVGVLQGLHAAHEARSERGAPLHTSFIGTSRRRTCSSAPTGSRGVIDFGVAKAVGRARVTRDSTIRGKIAYMAPEQLQGEEVDRRSDVYAAGVVLWELLTGHSLFAADSDAATLTRALHHRTQPPSTIDAAGAGGARRGGAAGDGAHADSPLRHRARDGGGDRAGDRAGELRARGRVGRRAGQRRPRRARGGHRAHRGAAGGGGNSRGASSERSGSWRAVAVVLVAACLTGGVAFAKFRTGAGTAASATAPVAAPPLAELAPEPAPLAPLASAQVPVAPTDEVPLTPDASTSARPRKPAKASSPRQSGSADPAGYQ